MTGELIALAAVLGGLGVTALIFHGIFSLIKMGIQSRQHRKTDLVDYVSVDDFNAYKSRMEKRVQTLEAIIAEDTRTLPEIESSEFDNEQLDFDSTKPKEDSRLRNQLRSD